MLTKSFCLLVGIFATFTVANAGDDGWVPVATPTIVNEPATTVYYPPSSTASYAAPVDTYCMPQTQVMTQRRYWAAKPVYETSEREERVVVRKPVYDTSYREEKYLVRKPVVETAEREETYTVLKPVYETSEREQRVQVCKPIYETQLQNRYVTQYMPYVSYQPTYLGWGVWGQTAVTAYAPQVMAQQVPIQTVRYAMEEEVRKQPVTTMKYVEEHQTRKVPVTTTRWVEEEKSRSIPQTTVRFEESVEVRKVPTTTMRIQWEERTEWVAAGS
ncbi:MAG: hypothetical protein IT427_08405 [Pirellulales bacterium]|nr:hypothetical protein [Pirellulales bacterium]